ncbi:MAG: divalent metal cation transporter [Armatimonadetes bacterium]|nr:divalent metal cation transporter [Armatimonadota bacterium]NIO75055.1 divalent metal cation transporter [Armatimonadota bacterium]NIO95705.1 divalent metal cation transporter [Armatimonadota bacterium]
MGRDLLYKKRLIAVRLKALAIFFAVVGPGIITANVDNDAGGIAVYSVAGANFGYRLLWVLIPTMIALIVIQEMCSRMGVATSKGLADLIRENFRVKITVWMMAALLFTNAANTAAEFAGLAAAGEILGASRYIIVPLCAFLIWALVVRWNYRAVEKVFLFACLIYIAYPISGFIARPDWNEVLRSTALPSLDFQPAFIMMIITVVGTTIAPWMQFYLQASVVEKGIRPEQYPWGRVEVIVGCIMAIVIAFFITVACGATIFAAGEPISDAAQAAAALKPLAGRFAYLLFAIGLFNASLFAASILPLSTALAVCEGIGWERGVDHTFKDAKAFYLLYTALIVVGAAVVLLPGISEAHLLKIMLVSQFLNGLLLPILLILMLRLINDRSLMGEHVNSRGYNIIAWATAIGIGLLTLGLGIASFL